MEMHVAHSWLHTNSSREKVTVKENIQCLPPQTFFDTWALWHFCLISLQIYMNNPNFLHIHIKSYVVHNDIQIHHTIILWCLVFSNASWAWNISHLNLLFKYVDISKISQVTYFNYYHKMTYKHILRLAKLDDVMD